MTSQTAGANPAKLTRRLWAILAVVLVADAVDLMDSTSSPRPPRSWMMSGPTLNKACAAATRPMARRVDVLKPGSVAWGSTPAPLPMSSVER